MDSRDLRWKAGDQVVAEERSAASARAIVRYRKLEDHLKAKDDKEGLSLLDDFATAMGI